MLSLLRAGLRVLSLLRSGWLKVLRLLMRVGWLMRELALLGEDRLRVGQLMLLTVCQ